MMFSRSCEWLCDTWTVIGKETKDLMHAAAGNPGVRRLWVLFALIFGVLFPWWMGHGWLERPQIILVWLLLPIPLVVAAVAESIAGEREHHTLEPLLATRLPACAILTGKSIVVTLFGWLGSVMIMLIGLIFMNLTESKALLHLYAPAMGGASLGLGLLAAFFTACIGILVSLHATTVRRAYVTMSVLLLGILLSVAGGAAIVLHLGLAFNSQMDGVVLALLTPAAIAAILLLADLALFIHAMRQFRRTHLIAD